jgi:hypothetical protein
MLAQSALVISLAGIVPLVVVPVIGCGHAAFGQASAPMGERLGWTHTDLTLDFNSARLDAFGDVPHSSSSAVASSAIDFRLALDGPIHTDARIDLGVVAPAADEAPESSASTASAADLAKAYHNPLGSLRALPMQLDLDFNVGESDKTSAVYTFQPIFPIKLNDDWTLVSYTILPVASAPGLMPGEDRSNGLGDLELFGYFTPADAPEGQLIWGIGPKLVVPTATDDDLGQDKLSLGPALALGVQTGNWTAFGLFDNVWSVAGGGDENVNEFNLQYYVTYQFPDGWFAISNLIIEADWRASSDDRWTVPIGGGFGRLFDLGDQSVALYAQAFYNIESPGDGSDWGIIFGFELIFP